MKKEFYFKEHGKNFLFGGMYLIYVNSFGFYFILKWFMPYSTEKFLTQIHLLIFNVSSSLKESILIEIYL